MRPWLYRLISALFALLLLFQGGRALHVNEARTVENSFLPGAVWNDSEGFPIQAHGGQVQRMPIPDGNGGKTEVYVWVGENKTDGHLGNPVAVYTSEDLVHWTCRGDVLRPLDSVEQIDTDPYFQALYGGYGEKEKRNLFDCIGRDKVIERPKILYNAKNDNYVLWFHSDGPTEKNS